MVKDRGGRIVLECQPALVRLLSQFDSSELVVARGERLPEFDCHIPLMSLPAVFRTEIGTIPSKIPYLNAEPLNVDRWRIAAPGPRVGLVWAGNPEHANDRNRSIGAEEIDGLSAPGATTWFSLQKSGAGVQRPRIDQMVHLGSALYDFNDTAAIINQLDLVISVDTAVAHLAGAMGKQVWVLLPFSADWRWLEDRDDSPWYPTMRLFRQPERKNWTPVIERVRQELEKLAANR